MDSYKQLGERDPEAPAGRCMEESNVGKAKVVGVFVVSGLLLLNLAATGASLARGNASSQLSACDGKPDKPAASKPLVVDTVGGPGSPLAKQVVVGMDTNVNLHKAWNQWEAWSTEMSPYWTEDMIYDFNYVGDWNFGPSHGLREWYDGEHMHFNGALPDSQWMDFIRAATDTTCTSASYGLARWVGPFAGVAPPPGNPWVKIRDLDFYIIENNRIKINWCIIDVVDLFSQGGYELLPPSPLAKDGYFAPKAMEGFPAPLSAFVQPEDTAASTAIWTEAVREDYLLGVGGARHWADEMTWYGPGGVGTAHSKSEYLKYFLEPLHSAFSDLEMHTDTSLCEGKFCGSHFYLYGTHTGEWLGEKPTGKRVPIRCGAHAHIEKGKIIEGWLIIDIPRAFHAMGVDLFARAQQYARTHQLA
jgi:predicted ester cyclase